MVTLNVMSRVQPANLSKAIAKAMEYRNRYPVVWLVADTRHDCIKLCRPAQGGLAYDTAAAEVWELNVYGSEYPDQYMQLVFTPGVLPKLEESTWRQRKRASSESKALYSQGQSTGNRAGR